MSENLSFTFSNPTPLCIGDPYKGDDIKRVKADDIDMDDLKNRTKNMITSPGKPGQTISTFSSMPFEYPRLFEGEEWVSKGQVNARNRLLAKKKQVYPPSPSIPPIVYTYIYMYIFFELCDFVVVVAGRAFLGHLGWLPEVRGWF